MNIKEKKELYEAFIKDYFRIGGPKDHRDITYICIEDTDHSISEPWLFDLLKEEA